MAKRSSYQPVVRDSAYYERIGLQVELERLQKQADEIRAQLQRYPVRILQRAQATAGAAPQGDVTSARRGGGAGVRPRTMSAAARKRISDAQKARWAKQRAAGGGQSPAPGASEGDMPAARRGRRARRARVASKRGIRKRTMSPEARKRIADSQRRRWALRRKQKG